MSVGTLTLHKSMSYKHPMSGMIVTAGLSHPQYNVALMRHVHQYLGHMEDLITKVPSFAALRIEHVAVFTAEDGVPGTLLAP